MSAVTLIVILFFAPAILWLGYVTIVSVLAIIGQCLFAPRRTPTPPRSFTSEERERAKAEHDDARTDFFVWLAVLLVVLTAVSLR